MKKAALYIHGKGGDFTEVESYRKNLSGCEVVGVDYAIDFPWITEKPIRAAYDALRREYGSIVLIANSIGAYLAMHALQDCPVGKALFISPVLDMERLILDMLGWAGATESDLREQGELPTDFGETLSWDYLTYVRAHPIAWTVPTEILYASGDTLISWETVDAFTKSHSANLTVLENGEHWFHTPEQLAFLDAWMARVL